MVVSVKLFRQQNGTLIQASTTILGWLGGILVDLLRKDPNNEVLVPKTRIENRQEIER